MGVAARVRQGGGLVLLAAAAANAQLWFVDIAPRSQFSYINDNNFTGPKYFPQPVCGGVAMFDYDNDGWPDSVMTWLNARPRILLKTARGGRHWRLIEVRPRLSNRDGIGTKMKVTTASGRELHNHVSPSVGFTSSSDKRVHFGLGAEPTAASIGIRWPSGKVTTLEGVKADQVLRVEEPEA